MKYAIGKINRQFPGSNLLIGMIRFYKLRFYDKWLQLPKPLSCLHRSFVYLYVLQTIHATFTIILLCTQREQFRGAQWPKCGAGKIFCVKSRFSESVADLARLEREQKQKGTIYFCISAWILCIMRYDWDKMPKIILQIHIGQDLSHSAPLYGNWAPSILSGWRHMQMLCWCTNYVLPQHNGRLR